LSRARIWPLIKFSDDAIIPGAYWKKAEGEADALEKWAAAVKGGSAVRL
jgi:hypothetical protein